MREMSQGPPLRRSLRPRGPVQFGVSVRREPGRTTLTVAGELDILTAPRLSAELATVARRTRGDIVIDLRHALFIDSAGLHILMCARRRLSRTDRRLTVVCDDGPVKRVIELARLEEALGLAAPRDERNDANAAPKVTAR